jgi:hypothetical protein
VAEDSDLQHVGAVEGRLCVEPVKDWLTSALCLEPGLQQAAVLPQGDQHR